MTLKDTFAELALQDDPAYTFGTLLTVTRDPSSRGTLTWGSHSIISSLAVWHKHQDPRLTLATLLNNLVCVYVPSPPPELEDLPEFDTIREAHDAYRLAMGATLGYNDLIDDPRIVEAEYVAGAVQDEIAVLCDEINDLVTDRSNGWIVSLKDDYELFEKILLTLLTDLDDTEVTVPMETTSKMNEYVAETSTKVQMFISALRKLAFNRYNKTLTEQSIFEDKDYDGI